MFYIGIVEDNNDPLKLGRLRIRVFGIHTENKTQIDSPTQLLLTEQLPWAIPAYPITNSSTDGISDFGGIVNGTKVFVFFLDRFKQKPVYFGVMPFIVDQTPVYENGFTDPNGEYPTDDYKDESSISRLARNEKTDDTCVKTKNDNLTTFQVGGIDVDEPESGYNTTYPYNRVIETQSGIIIELDSTPNSERIHIYHPSNSYTEVYPDGSKVSKIQGNDFDIVLQDKYAYVKGDLLLKVDGNSLVEINGTTDLICNGIATIELKDEASITAEKEIFIDGNDSINIMSSNEVNIGSANELNIAGGNTNITATGILTISATSAINVDATTALDINCATCSVTSTGIVTITGSLINLN